MLRRSTTLLFVALLLVVGCDQSEPTNQPPEAEFTTSIDRLTVEFTNESRDPDGSIQSVAWEFGDGETSTSANPSHTYPEVAEYTVRLTVTDNEGAETTVSRSVSLSPSLDVFVANQGNFRDNNGSVTVYDRDSSSTTRQAVSDLNSIVQGIGVNDGRLYVAANTGGRVDVFSAGSYSQVGQATGFDGTRYFAFPNDETAYVTDQSFRGSSSVRILDLSGSAPQQSKRIEVPGLPEGMTTTGGRVYAALGAFADTTLVGAFDSSAGTLTETIDVGCASRFVLADTETEVYAVCTDKPELVRLDGTDGSRLGSIALPDTAAAAGVGQNAYFAPEARELYVVVNRDRVLRIDTREETVEATIGPVDGDPIGGVAYDPEREELYLGRVPGFTERGTITIHDRSGAQTGFFPAGVAPTYITFRRTGGM